MSRPTLLDLFCCEGGASSGFDRAGFDVFGVDQSKAPLRRYPFPHTRGDAVEFVRRHGREFDAIAASPPCKVHNPLRHLHPEDLDAMLFPMPKHTNLIPATREALIATGRPWVIENVAGARDHMRDPVMLCGTMFGLGAVCRDGARRQLWRHRLFESNVPLVAPGPCAHVGEPVGVYGHGGGVGKTDSNRRRGFQATAPEARQALGAPWMSRDGLSQAIPPAYTEHIGGQLLKAVASWS